MSTTESLNSKITTGRVTRLIVICLLWLVAMSMLLPLLWMISTSLKVPGQEFQLPPKWIPDPITFRNYIALWKAAPFHRFFLNSTIVALSVTFGQLFTSSLAAFAFARLQFPFRDKIFLAYLATLMIPSIVTLIPVFIILHKLGWIDTYLALVIPGLFSAYGTFMLRQFFMTIPRDLEDAARIDGCSVFGVYLYVILPLSKPALAALSTIVFISAWRDFLWPLIVTNSLEMRTLTVGLSVFRGVYSSEWTMLMAGSMVVTFPLIVVFLVNQRFFIEGITLSGLKE